MADQYDDYDENKMMNLEKEVRKILEKEEKVYNYKLTKERIDWSEIGYTESTGAMALVHLRRNWETRDMIDVVQENEGAVKRKLWIAKDSLFQEQGDQE